MDSLDNIKTTITEKTSGIERNVDDFRTIFTPMQCAKFLVFLDKNQTIKEISNENLWNSLKKDDEYMEEERFEIKSERVESRNESF